MSASIEGKLPINKFKESILNTIKKSRAVVVVGETGSGKTTQLPQFLFRAGKDLFTKRRNVQVGSLLIFMFLLKAYSLISYRGRSQKFQNLNFLHLFVAFLQKIHFPKGI